MYCNKCGEELLEDAEFCVKCGFRLKENLVEKNKEQQKKSKKTKWFIVILTTVLIGVSLLFCKKYIFDVTDDPIIGSWTFDSSIMTDENGETTIQTLSMMSAITDELPTLHISSKQVVFTLMGQEVIGEWSPKVEREGDYFYTCNNEGVVFTIVMSENDNDSCTLILNLGTDNRSALFLFDREK